MFYVIYAITRAARPASVGNSSRTLKVDLNLQHSCKSPIWICSINKNHSVNCARISLHSLVSPYYDMVFMLVRNIFNSAKRAVVVVVGVVVIDVVVVVVVAAAAVLYMNTIN